MDRSKIERLRAGDIPIHEPGLDAVVERCVKAGRLRFSTSYVEAVAHAAVVFIAVGTPPGEDGSADLSHTCRTCWPARASWGGWSAATRWWW